MTAPIIGKPPEQKRGAVFGDVPQNTLLICSLDGSRYERVAPFRDATGWLNARRTRDGAPRHIPEDTPVTPLTVTPAEPEPDPAVTTYGELAVGDAFVWFAGGRVNFKLYQGWACIDGARGSDRNELRVRRVSPIEAAAHVLGKDAGASVVVHEEPGTLRVFEGGGPVVHEEASHRQRRIFIGDDWYTPKQAAGVVGEIAALLARRCAALLSTPEPAAAGPVCSCGIGGTDVDFDHVPDCHLYGPATADPEPRCCGSASEDRKGPDHEPQCHLYRDQHGPEPAEGRTRPAPGWEVGQRPGGHCMGRLADDTWTSDVFATRDHVTGFYVLADDGMLRDVANLSDLGCTADEALRAEVS